MRRGCRPLQRRNNHVARLDKKEEATRNRAWHELHHQARGLERIRNTLFDGTAMKQLYISEHCKQIGISFKQLAEKALIMSYLLKAFEYGLYTPDNDTIERIVKELKQGSLIDLFFSPQ
jgi:ribosome-binding protein aMBF1 (putative translation factor)